MICWYSPIQANKDTSFGLKYPCNKPEVSLFSIVNRGFAEFFPSEISQITIAQPDSCAKDGEFKAHCWQVDSAFRPSVGQ